MESSPDTSWTVEPVFADETTGHAVAWHELRHAGRPQAKRRGSHGVAWLRAVAAVLNRLQAVPLPSVRCAADAAVPSAYFIAHAKDHPQFDLTR